MNQLYTDIIQIRQNVFAEITRIAYSDEDLIEALENAPMKILPGEVSERRQSIFKERAIVGERLRLTLGLPVRKASEFRRLSEGIKAIDETERVYEAPLVNVIPFACNACPTKALEVTSTCRQCMAQPCIQVCPVGAITMGETQTHIDKEKCIKCGKCKEACPYNAIIQYDRPCAEACGVNAIGSDEYGRALIDHDKCVSCGQCMAHCPFGAIADKAQIYQLVKSIRNKKQKHIAIVAPAFVSQFGDKITPAQVFEGIKMLGFDDVVEVGLGADIATINEAKEFLHVVPNELPYLATSCCPAWVSMVNKMFPEVVPQVSDALSPMKFTVQHIRKTDPDVKIVFVGPCVAKKLEALGEEMKSYVDFVITFEELMGMFVGKGIDLAAIETDNVVNDCSAIGRGFAQAGGVAGAVQAYIKEIEPERELMLEAADGLHDCVKLARLAKAGKKNGYLIEGMGCPGGCIAGAGTLAPYNKAQKALNNFMKAAEYQSPTQNPLLDK